MEETEMAKIYIEPEIKIYDVTLNIPMLVGSLVENPTNFKQETIDDDNTGIVDGEYSREGDIFNSSHSIWDNAW